MNTHKNDVRIIIFFSFDFKENSKLCTVDTNFFKIATGIFDNSYLLL